MKKLLISCLVFLSGFISVHGQVYTGAAIIRNIPIKSKLKRMHVS